jgi:hypothetical protein
MLARPREAVRGSVRESRSPVPERPVQVASAAAWPRDTAPDGSGRLSVRFIFLSRSTSITWFQVLADDAQSAVPNDAAASVGSRTGPPWARKPADVVRTTRAERRALDRSE